MELKDKTANGAVLTFQADSGCFYVFIRHMSRMDVVRICEDGGQILGHISPCPTLQRVLEMPATLVATLVL